jgi:hypothetical protein
MGKMPEKRKVGRQGMRWIEEVETSTQINLVELSKAARNRNTWRALIWKIAGFASDSMEIRR